MIKNNTRSYLRVLFLISLLLLYFINPLFEWVSYNMYYKNMYSLFSGSLYFPFYMYLVLSAFIIALVLGVAGLLFKYMLQDNRSRKKAFYNSVFSVLLFGTILYFVFLHVKDCCADYVLTQQNKYEVKEIQEYKIYRHVSKKGSRITYRIADESNLKHPVRAEKEQLLYMNIYQYRTFISDSILNPYVTYNIGDRIKYDMRKKDKYKFLRILYMPNTEQIIAFQIDDKLRE